MSAATIDYDQVAGSYDRRYAVNPLVGVERALRSLAKDRRVDSLLEVGCGGGRWLERLAGAAARRIGGDPSLGMLRLASRAAEGASLVACRANRLPFVSGAFDLVLSVNALHHFDDPERWIRQSAELLRGGGALAVVGMDPHRPEHRWYIYDYFAGTLKTDLERYPSAARLRHWMLATRLARVESTEVERIAMTFHGREVLDDYFLQKGAGSQLMLLTDEAYRAGLRKLREAVEQAELAGREILFPVDIRLILVSGQRAGL